MINIETQRIPTLDCNTAIDHAVKQAAEVYDKYGRAIRKIITSLSGEEEVIDDIFQDFFLSLVRTPIPKQVCSTHETIAYLYRAICNDIINNRHKSVVYLSHLEEYIENSKNNTEDHKLLSSIFSAENTWDMIRLLQQHLTRREAQAIILRYVHDFSANEAAKRMNISIGSVYRYCSVGIKKMRESVKENRQIRCMIHIDRFNEND